MSYSVFRLQGIKTTGDLKGISKHDKDRISTTNPDIDKSRSKDNITLIDCDNYLKKFNEIVAPMKEDHEEKMKTMRSDRVKTFDTYINSSKNDIAFEMIFTSDNAFFQNMNKADIRKWADSSLKFVTNDLGIPKNNLIHAVIHMDEQTPHLHVIAVPLVKKFNKKQNKEVWSISRRQYINGKQQLSLAQDLYNQRMNNNGFKLERGEKGSRNIHTTKAQYLKQQSKLLEEEISKTQKELSMALESKEMLSEDINTLQGILNRLESDLNGIQTARSIIGGIDNIEFKKSSLGAKVSLKEDDFTAIIDSAKNGVMKSLQLDKLQKDFDTLKTKNTNLEKKNTLLKLDLDKLKKDTAKLSGKLNYVIDQAKAFKATIEDHPDKDLLMTTAKENLNSILNEKMDRSIKNTITEEYDLER